MPTSDIQCCNFGLVGSSANPAIQAQVDTQCQSTDADIEQRQPLELQETACRDKALVRPGSSLPGSFHQELP